MDFNVYLQLCATILFVVLLFAYFRKGSKYKLPPGPPGLPIIGNIHQLMSQNPYKVLSQWAANYGKIYTIHLGTKPCVVINNPKLLRQIFGTFQSTGKFQTDTMLRISKGPFGVLNSDGESWAEQRHFCLKSLRQFGFGNKGMGALILGECESVCEWIINQGPHKVVKMQEIFVHAAINTIWTIVSSSSQISLGENKMVELMDEFVKAFQYTMKTGLLFLPWLKWVAPGLSGYTAYEKACTKMHKHIETEFENHKSCYVEGAPKDLIDKYLEYVGNESEDKLKWKNAVGTVIELFIAGSETTASTLNWILFYLSQNPQVERKLQNEIDREIGGIGQQQPTLEHKSKMPFTEAVILETLRITSYAPIGTIHKLLDDLEIEKENLRLPKDLLLIANLYHCHHDQLVWNDPQVFRPERFLGEVGSLLKEHLVPFQAGKRQCLGEPLAKDILFIFLTRLFQQFNVEQDPRVNTEEYFKADVGVVLFPPPLGVIFKLRAKE